MSKKKVRVIIAVLFLFSFSISLYALTNEEQLQLLEIRILKGEINQKQYQELRKKYLAANPTKLAQKQPAKNPPSVDEVKQGEIIISEFNDLSRWKVSCEDPKTKVNLSIEKYDAKFRGGCLRLKFVGTGNIYLKLVDGRPSGGTPKMFRVWSKGEDLENISVGLKGLFRSPEGLTKEIWLADYFQPYWMINSCDFRFKKQVAWRLETHAGLADADAVGGSHVLEGFRIIPRANSKGTLYFAQASVWGDNLTTKDRLFFPEEKKKIDLYGRNLLRNGGFEGGSLGWGVTGHSKVDATVAHKGNQSLCMKLTAGGEYSYFQKPDLSFMHLKGAKVKIGAWSKAKNVTGAKDTGYMMHCAIWYTDGTRQYPPSIYFDVGTHDWKYYEETVQSVPHKEIELLRVSLNFRGKHTGTVWFDDISCELVAEHSPKETEKLSLTPLVKNSLKISQRWQPQKVRSKTFYTPIAPEGQTKGYMVKLNPSSIEHLSAGFKLALQEIEVFSGRKNIAPEAKVQAEVEFGELKDVPRVNNGSKEEKPCLSEPSAPVPLAGSFSLHFKKTRDVDRVVLHHGLKSEGKFGYIAESFHLQYRKEGKWVNIPGTEREGNRNPITDLKFAGVKTDALRLIIQRESDANNKLLGEILGEQFGKNIPVHGGEAYPRLGNGSVYKSPRFDVTHLKRFNHQMERIYGEAWFGYQQSEWDNSIAPYLKLVSKGISSEGKVYKKALPKSKKEAYQIFAELFSKIREKEGGRGWGMSTWNYNHYNMQWGSCLSSTELTAPVGKYPIQLAFTRGAARQYQKPWNIYLAHYMGNWNARSYSETGRGLGGYPGYPYGHSPDAGPTVSLEKRIHYLSYLAGANIITAEGTPFFSDLDADGRKELSPWGEAILQWLNFIERHPERGITYAPMGIMLDYLHGWHASTLKASYESKTWGVLPYKEEDFMVNGFMYTVWPLNPNRFIDQPNFALCNATEEHPWGDIFDVIVPNFPGNVLDYKTLSDYRVLFAVGGFTITEEFARQLKEYVKNGGTLVLNISQTKGSLREKDFLGVKIEKGTALSTGIKYLEEGEKVGSLVFDIQKVKATTAKVIAEGDGGHPLILVNSYGKGVVILTTPPYLLDFELKILPLAGYLLRRMTKEVLPLQVKGDIEYIINRNEKGWVVGLINNNGIYKKCDMRNPGWKKGTPTYFDGVYNPEIVDESKTSEVLITSPGYISGASELVQDLIVPVYQTKGNSEVQIRVPPGEVRVLQLLIE